MAKAAWPLFCKRWRKRYRDISQQASQQAAKCALGDRDTQGLVTEPDHRIPLLPPLPWLSQPFASPSAPGTLPGPFRSWVAGGLGTRFPCPWPAGLCGQLPAGRRRPWAGCRPVRTCGGCVPQAVTPQPALISEALQCSGRIFFVVGFFPKSPHFPGKCAAKRFQKGLARLPGDVSTLPLQCGTPLTPARVQPPALCSWWNQEAQVEGAGSG